MSAEFLHSIMAAQPLTRESDVYIPSKPPTVKNYLNEPLAVAVDAQIEISKYS